MTLAMHTPEVYDQDFALVISAAIVPSGHGIVLLDRRAYTVPGVIKLTLVDYDLTNQTTATIQLRNTSIIERRGHCVAGKRIKRRVYREGCHGDGAGQTDWAFAGSTTANTIEAVYQDDDPPPPTLRVFTARADLLPPVISNVSVTNRFGRVLHSMANGRNGQQPITVWGHYRAGVGGDQPNPAHQPCSIRGRIGVGANLLL